MQTTGNERNVAGIAEGSLTGDGALSSYIKGIFEAFKSARQPWEDIWEECWYNFLGEYHTERVWRRETEGTNGNSQAFIKLTALKCNTAHSKVIDVLFAGRGEVPFICTPVDYEALGLTIDQAKEISDKSRERIRDHFRKIDFEEIITTGALDLMILGTAVLKGPMAEVRRKTVIRQRTIGNTPISTLDDSLQPYEITYEDEVVPVIDLIPLWEYYCDPNARTNKDSIGEIHFQRLLPAKFKLLAATPGYIKENVLEAAQRATSDDPDDLKRVMLSDRYMGTQGEKDKRVSTLEYWGLVPVKILNELPEQMRPQLPSNVEEHDDVECLVVLAADGIVCKVTLNPLGFRIFHPCPCKERPHIIYGEGIAESMRDSQKMVNSAARMIIDNKALSGNGMVAINLSRIDQKRTKNMRVYPRKTWYVKGNFAPKDCIDTISFEDVTRGLQELMEMFERFADEETGIPKYTSGQQDSFLNKTAAGMSMLMTQANIGLKTILKNIDNYWIEPIVEAFYAWFTELDAERMPMIPIQIKATGTESLIAKEIKMEQYLKALQITQNPRDAIFIDRPKLMAEIFRCLDIADVVRPKEEVAQIMKVMSDMGQQEKDWKEFVDIDRLFPLLAPSEQDQLLTLMNIKPDAMKRPKPVAKPPAGGNGKAALQ